MGTPRSTESGGTTATFDVRMWLAGLTGVDGWHVSHTFTRRKVEFVAEYATVAGATAQITMRALPTAGNASWEMAVEAAGHQATVVIPARTRIKW